MQRRAAQRQDGHHRGQLLHDVRKNESERHRFPWLLSDEFCCDAQGPRLSFWSSEMSRYATADRYEH